MPGWSKVWSELVESMFGFFYSFSSGTVGEATTGVLRGLAATVGFIMVMVFGLVATLFMPPKSKSK
jgi:hypothetical protein